MTITRSNLFEFLSGWDFQPEADRLQVVKDFYISEPDATETAYSTLDWDALPPVVRESLIDASTESERVPRGQTVCEPCLKGQHKDCIGPARCTCFRANFLHCPEMGKA